MEQNGTSKERSKAKALIRVAKANNKQTLILYFKQGGKGLQGEYHAEINNPSQVAQFLLAIAERDPLIAQVVQETYRLITEKSVQQFHSQMQKREALRNDRKSAEKK